MNLRVARIALTVAVIAILVPLAGPQAVASTCPETTFLGDYPNDDYDPGWTDNVQGVAHDDGHWFFTTNFEQGTPDGKYLLKFPVDFDLATTIDVDNPPSGVVVNTDAMPGPLKELGYEHFGDLDQAGGFLFVPIDEGRGDALIGVFRASDLSFVGFKQTEQSGAAWIAYNRNQGILYSATSSISAEGLYRYSLDLDMLGPLEMSTQASRFWIASPSVRPTAVCLPWRSTSVRAAYSRRGETSTSSTGPRTPIPTITLR